MGFLNPLLLLAAAAAAVPLILHLFHRHDARRVVFPALQYLLRTEKEHARTIRFRQIVLLVLRIAAVVLLALVAARPFLRGGGGVHEPTALAIILDNSASSGRIVGEARVLDQLKATAVESLQRGSDEDRLWVILAGEPWTPALHGSAEQLLEAIEPVTATAASSDLSGAIERAAILVREAGLSAREIHLVSDLQGSAFPRPTGEVSELSIVALGAVEGNDDNLYLGDLVVGGGLTPLANERSELSVSVGGPADSLAVPLRLVIGGRILGAGNGRPGEAAILPFGPHPTGWVTGYVETDPDALSVDDRRYFAFPVRAPPRVRVSGEASFFLSTALPVLEDARRIDADPVAGDVLIAVAGSGLGSGSTSAVVFPDADPTSLPALNRRLANAGIAWRYEMSRSRGEAGVRSSSIPVDLGGIRVRQYFDISPGPSADTSRVLARLTSGEPWIVEAGRSEARVLLVASPVEEDASSLPVTAAMMPLLDWMLGSWSAASGPSTSLDAGAALPLAPGSVAVVDPAGTRHEVGGTGPFVETGRAGVYEVHGDGGVLSRVAVNPPAEESRLDYLDESELERLIEGDVRFVRDADRWSRSVFVGSQGPEIGHAVLFLIVMVLLVESFVAAAGATRQSKSVPGTPGSERSNAA